MSDFAKIAVKKFVENLLSVKVWILLLNYGMATYLCWNGKISYERSFQSRKGKIW